MGDTNNKTTKCPKDRSWADDDDQFLIFYGRCVGHEFVGEHDLNRQPGEATDRMIWLRANKPSLVQELEAAADRNVAL